MKKLREKLLSRSKEQLQAIYSAVLDNISRDQKWAKDIFRRYPKTTLGSLGAILTGAVIIYEKENIHKLISPYVGFSFSSPEVSKPPDYIYIEPHIYNDLLRRKEEKEASKNRWFGFIINPPLKWWKMLRHSLAWRLLHIAQTGTQPERIKAVRQMVNLKHLKDWDYQHLAQVCDARTSVSLARCGADVRWFMHPHKRGCIRNPKVILFQLRDMLARLRPNACVDNFFAKYFPQQYIPDAGDVDQFVTYDQLMVLSQHDTDMLKEIVAFLHHLTKKPETAARIIDLGGLSLLLELSKIFVEDNETLTSLCKVLANMSVVDYSLQHFFQSGWIRVLAEWCKCQDLRLQLISSKTLANLDDDDPQKCKYSPNVYPLFPCGRARIYPKADIIFIHGLLGSVFITWRQRNSNCTELGLYGKNAFYVGENNEFVDEPKSKDVKELSNTKSKNVKQTSKLKEKLDDDWQVVFPDVPLDGTCPCDSSCSIDGSQWSDDDCTKYYTNCWPMDWLPADVPYTRIIGIDYTSALTEWSANFAKYCPCEKEQGRFDVRAATLLERISKSDVGKDRPIIWVGHSMGGILIKLMLMAAKESTDPKVQQIAKNTAAIVFLGTPHRGSPIAKFKQHMQVLISPSIEVKELEEDSPKLLELHERFCECLDDCFQDVRIISFAEGVPTMLTTFKLPLKIVTEHSAFMEHGEFFVMKDDHLSLSKPVFKESFFYQRLLQLIKEILHDENMESRGSFYNWSTQLREFANEKTAAFKISKEKMQETVRIIDAALKSKIKDYSFLQTISDFIKDFKSKWP